MKKHIILGFVFLGLLGLLVFFINRNSIIQKEKKEYLHIENILYELKFLHEHKKMLLQTLHKSRNYDAITELSKELEDRFNYLVETIKATDNSKFNEVIQKLQYDQRVSHQIYEDLKTDSALIENSKIWISKSYKKYLQQTKKEDYDLDVLQNLYYLIDVENITNIKASVLGVFVNFGVMKHVELIIKKRKEIDQHYKEYAQHDINKNIDKLLLLVLRHLNDLNKEIANVVSALLALSFFTLLFMVAVYIREVLIAKETERLKNDLQQFKDALDVSAIVSKTDSKGIITYANEQFIKISQYTLDELIGQPQNIVRHSEMPSTIFRQLWETIKAKKIFKAIIKNKAKDGSAYYVDTTIIPILNVDEEIEEFLAVRYDVTELVQSRDMAIVAEKAKGEFLSNMSHELRTPLNSINGFTEILQRKITDPKHLTYLQNIKDSSDNLIGLINDILDLSKLQSGKFVLDPFDFNLKEKLELFLKRFDSLLGASSLQMHKNVDSSTNTVLYGDWLRISQVLTNLISNAIKFSPENDAIEIGASYKDGIVYFSVIDHGIGMNKEAQAKVFKPFEQADGSTTRKYGGTGLGLSIVMSLLEQMDAKIDLQSEEGKGSAFFVEIPLQKSSSQKLDNENKEETEKEKLRGNILVAEDNKTNQMLVTILLEEYGLNFTIANDGEEAVEAFEKEHFDLVLMDENMPNMNGIEAMKEIRKRHGDTVAIIALTANAMSGDKERFIQQGMSDYVAKPIDEDELYEVLRRYLKSE